MSEHEYETVFLIDSTNKVYDQHLLLLSAYPVKILDAPESGIRNFTNVGFDAEPLADLHVVAQLDRTSNGQPYGWKVEYRDVYSVDLRRADTMLKTLRKVERGLTRIQTELGYPETFPAYLARVAKVLGIKRFGWRVGERNGHSYSDNEYRWTDADGMAYHVNDLCAKFLDTERVA